MRHVSRTHRVAVDWVFDIINLDSKIQTRDIDTKHQLADIFTKGCFTSDESKNLLHVMEDAPKLFKFPNQNLQTFGFVFQSTNGPNHGPVWKIQSFLLNEICMVIFWQDCYGKGNMRKSF